jgi:hypothetical protein
VGADGHEALLEFRDRPLRSMARGSAEALNEGLPRAKRRLNPKTTEAAQRAASEAK